MEALNKIIDQIKQLLAPIIDGAKSGADSATTAAAPGDATTGPAPTWQDKAKTYAAQAKEQAGPQMEKAKTYAAQAKEQAGPQMAKVKEQAGPQVAKVKERMTAK